MRVRSRSVSASGILVGPGSCRLVLERLEERDVPSITILIDYRYDLRANGGAGFFEDNPAARAVIERVAQELGQRVSANLSAIVPSGTNTWTATFFHPRTGQQVSISNPTVPANTIVVYVGGRAMPGPEAGVGGYGGYRWSGTSAWGNTIARRGWSGFAPWGGSIAFDTTENWHFGLTTEGLTRNQLDFYSVALHELGHVLGIGTAPQWSHQLQNGYFVGPHAVSVYGGPVPLSGGGHWAEGVAVAGQVTAMSPVINYGERRTWTSLDQAALRDVGWLAGAGVGSPVVPPTGAVPPPAPVPPLPPPPPSSVPPGRSVPPPVLIAGAGGRVDVYTAGPDGNLLPTGRSFVPFPGYGGPVRSAVADFNGDGVPDFAFVTAGGTASRVRVIDGATGGTLAGPQFVLGGFGGGAFLAAGDLDRDGRAELIVGADAGGWPTVEVYRLGDNRLTLTSGFLAFAVQNGGGVRVALGDVNRDGVPDLIVGSGRGLVPRVRVLDGGSVLSGRAVPLVPAFFPFGAGARVGVNVAAGDLDGDGHDEVIVSQDAGGTSRVRIWSGADLTAHPTAPPHAYAPWRDFFANGTDSRNGIRAVTRDLDGDGVHELVTSAADASGWVRVLSVNGSEVRALAPVFPGNGFGSLAGAAAGPSRPMPQGEEPDDLQGWLPPGGPCLCCVPRLIRPVCSRLVPG